MDDLSTLLARNFGIQQVGKSAPMSAAKPSAAAAANPIPASGQFSDPWNRRSTDDSFLWDDLIVGDQKTPIYDDIFGGPPLRPNPSYGRSVSSPSPSLDSLFDGLGIPTEPPSSFDPLFPTIPPPPPPPTHSYLDILGGRSETEAVSDELIPGFGGSIFPQIKKPSPVSRKTVANHEADNDVWLTAFDATKSNGPKITPPPAIKRPATTGRPARPAPVARVRAAAEAEERTRQRMADALESKIERDMEAQREEEERKRITDLLDSQIRRWAVGKEGNLRALLSSLHDVLWPECGWKPVGLADLITSVSVKKVYRDATLCLHPDKVQQKGADLRQKCIAAKVFDLLKEAWNKFNSEELQRS